MENVVALSALGILGGAVVTIGWVAKFALTKFGGDLQEHTKAALKQSATNGDVARAMRDNTDISHELLNYMKNLNGKLGKITRQTVNEQTVAHQTVQDTNKE